MVTIGVFPYHHFLLVLLPPFQCKSLPSRTVIVTAAHRWQPAWRPCHDGYLTFPSQLYIFTCAIFFQHHQLHRATPGAFTPWNELRSWGPLGSPFAHLLGLVWWRRLLAGQFTHSASRHHPTMHATKELSMWSNFMNGLKRVDPKGCDLRLWASFRSRMRWPGCQNIFKIKKSTLSSFTIVILWFCFSK